MEKITFFRAVIIFYVIIREFELENWKKEGPFGGHIGWDMGNGEASTFFFPPCKCPSTNLSRVVLRCIAAHLGCSFIYVSLGCFWLFLLCLLLF
jgi:hypothetical protein